MLSPQLLLDVHHEIVVDVFAGGGGMSTGIERAIGRHVDVAINHNPDALSLHQANHPQTRHLVRDVREVCPRMATGGRPVGGLHLSPDCTHHSQAKGGQPRDEELRALPWVGVRWIGTVAPRIVTGENVREILLWGPLVAKRCPVTRRVVKIDGTVAAKGEVVPRRQQFLVPDKKRQGQHWRRFVAIHRAKGYEIEWRVLNAADHDVPTKRRRLIWIARRDGAPIVWPEPVRHEKPQRGQKRWRAAAEAIDFGIPCPSIFTRERPLAEATLRRIAHGMRKFVLESADPFIVPVTHQGSLRVHDIREPMRTITGAHRGEFALASAVLAPAIVTNTTGHPGTAVSTPLPTITTAGNQMLAAATLVQMGHGDGKPGARRWSYGANDIRGPVGTITASGGGQALAAAMLVQANGGFNATPARACSEPMSTITTTGSQQQLVMAHLAQLRNNCSSRDLREPLQVISAGGEHHALVEYTLTKEHEEGALRCAAFLMRYHGHGGQWSDLRDPLTTITTKDRLALVTVWLKGEPYVIVDIGLRMLTPRELYNANGFPANYVIDRGHDGRRFTRTQQVHFCGNAVPPGLGYAVWAANWHAAPALRRAA